MAKKSKPALLPVEDLSSDSSDQDKEQVVSDSVESYEEFGEDEIDEDAFNLDGLPHDEDEVSVSDVSVSSSEDEILTMKKKLEHKQAKHRKTVPSDSDEESKEPKDVSKLVKKNPDIVKGRGPKQGELEVNFELV